MSNFNEKETLSKELKKEKPELQKQFVKIARALKWPENLIAATSVRIDGTKITFDVNPPSLKKEVENLEYGNFNIFPAAAQRAFVKRIPNEVGQKITAKTFITMIDEVLL